MGAAGSIFSTLPCIRSCVANAPCSACSGPASPASPAAMAQPKPSRMVVASLPEIPPGLSPEPASVGPRIRCISLMRSVTGGRPTVRARASACCTSTSEPDTKPPDASRIRLTSAEAAGAASKSAPRSKRCEASVCRPCRFDDLRIVAGSNHAASTSTFFVAGVIIESHPPITPASDNARRSSAITRSSGSSVRSTPSSVLSVSPARARRTTMPPSIRSRSNACVGCPIACVT